MSVLLKAVRPPSLARLVLLENFPSEVLSISSRLFSERVLVTER